MKIEDKNQYEDSQDAPEEFEDNIDYKYDEEKDTDDEDQLYELYSDAKISS